MGAKDSLTKTRLTGLGVFQRIGRAGGFSLIEMCFVIMITGLLVSGAAQALELYFKKHAVEVTNANLEKIQDAIAAYLGKNGFYPCPSVMNVDTDSPAYSVATNCAVAAGLGVTDVSSSAGVVRVGGIPGRNIGLPDSVLRDGWSHRITYAVARDLAYSSAAFNADNGTIRLNNLSGGAVLLSSTGVMEYAHYVLVSAGPDGKGAYIASGTTPPCTPGSGKDEENCNNDATFVYSVDRSTAEGMDHYDDFVAYLAKGMSNNMVTCPAGQMLTGIIGGVPQCVAGSSTPASGDLTACTSGGLGTCTCPSGWTAMVTGAPLSPEMFWINLATLPVYYVCRKN